MPLFCLFCERVTSVLLYSCRLAFPLDHPPHCCTPVAQLTLTLTQRSPPLRWLPAYTSLALGHRRYNSLRSTHLPWGLPHALLLYLDLSIYTPGSAFNWSRRSARQLSYTSSLLPSSVCYASYSKLIDAAGSHRNLIVLILRFCPDV